MRQKSTTPASPSERLVKTIRRATRKHYSAEEKIRIVLDGLRGEQSMPSCAAARASPRAYTTAGRRSSWRPANAAWRATRPERRAATK